MTAYTLGDVARICGVSRRRVRYWERTSLIGPTLADVTPEFAEQPAFEFRDLVSVRSIVGLLERGVPLREIRRTADTLRPGVQLGWASPRHATSQPAHTPTAGASQLWRCWSRA